jgi:hypothetical protein
MKKKPTLLRNIHPDSVLVECVFIGVESFECVFVSRIFTVHGGIVLVTEDDARAGHTLA